jgi:hypothetical protein
MIDTEACSKYRRTFIEPVGVAAHKKAVRRSYEVKGLYLDEPHIPEKFYPRAHVCN